MTLPPMPDVASDPRTRLAHEVATASAAVLPSSEPLEAGEAQPGTEHIASLFAAAVTAGLTGAVNGTVTLLVGEELVETLRTSPLGQLDVAAALQPALDAAAAALGSSVGAGAEAPLDTVVELQGGGFVAVPLIGAGIAAALLVPDATLASSLTAAQRAADPSATGAPSAPVEELHPGSVDPVSAIETMAPVGSAVTPPPGGASVHPIAAGRRGIEMLHGVEMEVTVELGRTRMAVRDLLALAPGTVLALDRAAGAPADLLVNGRLVARGEVVVVDEDFGLRVTEILDHSAVV
ncbi:flagellar motor switch protein FliN [Nocardioides rubriscoriae]|uniref:flagellar motor switch protein FliN n=1 Tax=Nocardioides rubriscoriae TaxID=642762 RepID=UPI0011DFC881|nr:flagellar motor switch protein FliN [Nocardioides rubriscoriae]